MAASAAEDTRPVHTLTQHNILLTGLLLVNHDVCIPVYDPDQPLSDPQHSTAQHSTAQHSTAQHSTAQHSTAQHSTAQSTAYLGTSATSTFEDVLA